MLLFGWLVRLLENFGRFFYWLFRKLLILALVTAVVTFVGLLALYYRASGHLPFNGERISDFGNFAMDKLRWAERRVRTEWDKIDWSQVAEPSRRLLESAQATFDELQTKVRKAAERAKNTSPAGAQQDLDDVAMDQAMRWFHTGLEHYRRSFPGQAEHDENLRKAMEAFEKSKDVLQEVMDRNPRHAGAMEVRQSVETFLVDCRKRKRV